MKNRITYYSIFTLLAAALSLASCQSIESLRPLDEEPQISNRIEITGTIVKSDNTRVDFVFPEGGGITPTWTYDSENPDNCDKIFGFDDKGGSFELIVNSPEVDGAVSFSVTEGSSYAPENGTTVFAIYYPGKGIGDLIMENEIPTGLAIDDLSSQNGVLDKRAPALMLATGIVSGGKLDLAFHNQTAIVGLKTITVGAGDQLKRNSNVQKVTLSGVASEGIISVVDNKLTLTANNNSGSIIARPDEGTNWATDNNGQIDFTDNNNYQTPLCFVVLPFEDSNPLVNAECDGVSYTHSAGLGKKDIRVNYYYSMNRVLNLSGDAVASTTIGNTTTNYNTIDAAWAVANASSSDVTVTLLADCAAAATLVLDNTDSGTGEVTLDLNGNCLSAPDENSSNYPYVVRVSNERKLIIRDNSSTDEDAQGSIIGNTKAHPVYVSSSDIDVYGGNIINVASDKYSIYMISSSTGNIYGGKITSAYRGVYCNSILNISGGSFYSNSNNVASAGTGLVIITGGYFASENPSIELFTLLKVNNNSGKCYVSGGCADRPINSNRTYIYNGNPVTQSDRRSNRLNPDNNTKEAYPFEVGDYNKYYETNNGDNTYRHATLSSAAKHANIAVSNITIKPTGNRTGVGSVTLDNEKGYAITLDLNGKNLSATKENLLNLGGNVTITDTGNPKAKISCTKMKIITITTADSNITLDGVTIECSASGSSYFDDSVVYMNSASSIMNIYNSTVYSTGSLTTISNRAGTLNITDSEVSSGTSSTGLVGVCAYGSDANVTINSGCIYTSNTTGTRPAAYAASGGTFIIEGGFFYGGSSSIRTASITDFAQRFTVKGGYFNKQPKSTPQGSTTSYTPYYVDCSLQSASKTYTHSLKGMLNFNYQAVPTSGETSVNE